MMNTILNSKQLGLELLGITQPSVGLNNTAENEIKENFLSHPSVITDTFQGDLSDPSIYVGDPKIVRDTYMRLGQTPLDEALRQTGPHLERPKVQGTHQFFMNVPLLNEPAIIQVGKTNGRDFDVNPLIAKLARMVHPDFGRAEVQTMPLPEKLEEYFPEIARLFGISKKADLPATKEALVEALNYSEHLKPGFSDGIMTAVIRAIKKNL
jgi:hypothetical protein